MNTNVNTSCVIISDIFNLYRETTSQRIILKLRIWLLEKFRCDTILKEHNIWSKLCDTKKLSCHENYWTNFFITIKFYYLVKKFI